MDQENTHPFNQTVWKAVAVMLSLFILALVVSEVKEWRYIGKDVALQNTVTVSGEGEAFAVPDVATFSFSVIEEAQTASEAQNVAADKIQVVLDRVETFGIDEKDIKTTSYNLQPRYEYIRSASGPRKQVFVGFEVNQTVRVKVREVEKAGDIVGAVGQLEVSNISGLNFEVDDADAIVREARKEAIEKAQEKADQLEKDLGVSLGRIVQFNEFGGGSPVPYMERSFADDGAQSASVELPRGENRVTTTVSITYEIR